MDKDQHTAHLRSLVHQAVGATSLRAVARDVGLSPTGLKKFLAGAAPYSTTRRKLEAWEERHTAGGREREIGAALDVLLIRVPPAKRPEADRTIRELVAMLERQAAVPAPRPALGLGPTFFCRFCNRDFPVVEEAAHGKMHRDELYGG